MIIIFSSDSATSLLENLVALLNNFSLHIFTSIYETSLCT